jgi:hypothetical protein
MFVLPIFVWSVILDSASKHSVIHDIGSWPDLVLFLLFAYWFIFFCMRTSGVALKPVRRGDPSARSMELTVGICIGALGLVAAVVVPLALR